LSSVEYLCCWIIYIWYKKMDYTESISNT